jgi:hypothetical protein
MSFGFSIGDIILLIQLTRNAYNNWKNACGEYTEITGQLNSLYVILKRLDWERKAPESLLGRNDADLDGLLRVLENSKTTVTKLSNVISKFRSLGQSRKSNWDRLKLANNDLGELRSKLNLHISTLTAYLETIGVSALGRIENGLGELPKMRRAIDRIASEIRAGSRGGSVVSMMTAYDGDDPRVWRELRGELIRNGFSSDSIKKCRPQLTQYVRCLYEEGLFEENPSLSSAKIPSYGAARREKSPASRPQLIRRVISMKEPNRPGQSPADYGNRNRKPATGLLSLLWMAMT